MDGPLKEERPTATRHDSTAPPSTGYANLSHTSAKVDWMAGGGADSSSSPNSVPKSVLVSLQRMVGNRTVTSLLQRSVSTVVQRIDEFGGEEVGYSAAGLAADRRSAEWLSSHPPANGAAIERYLRMAEVASTRRGQLRPILASALLAAVSDRLGTLLASPESSSNGFVREALESAVRTARDCARQIGESVRRPNGAWSADLFRFRTRAVSDNLWAARVAGGEPRWEDRQLAAPRSLRRNQVQLVLDQLPAESIGREFVLRYAYGNGQTWRLSVEEMARCNARIDLGDDMHPQFRSILEQQANAGQRIARHEFTGASRAMAIGSLGGFTIHYRGNVELDGTGGWTFAGTMNWTDEEDFEPHTEGERGSPGGRGSQGEALTTIGRWILPGQPYHVMSVTVPVHQTSEQPHLQWAGDTEGQPAHMIPASGIAGAVASEGALPVREGVIGGR